MGTRRLRCLLRRHQWHKGWDDYDQVMVWTCERCGKGRRIRVSSGTPRNQTYHPPMGGQGGDFGGGGDGGW